VPFHRHRPKVIKVFCAAFFQKSGRFPSHGANATARHVKKILQSDWLREVLSWLAAHYLLLVAKTLRWRISGEAQLQEMATGAPMIVVFWHEAIPSMPIFWQQVKRRGVVRPAVALASRHRDGQLIGRVIEHMGIGLVSGSSSRGGATGLRGLLNALSAGTHVGLTPDGPRGPRRVCAPGVAQLAALSGRRVLPCAALTSRAKTLGTWDKMRLPLPFGHGVLVCGEPITVSREEWLSGVETVTAALNAAMDRAAELL
jgi:lysophospholipid acyltransferase (LPLAT)-like uncharacterized protein